MNGRCGEGSGVKGGGVLVVRGVSLKYGIWLQRSVAHDLLVSDQVHIL